MATILVAEDNEGIRESIVTLLQAEGHTLLESADGEAALSILKSRDDVDLLLTDVIMPERDGIELVMELKHLKHRPRVAVCSGGSQRVAVQNILDACSFMADAVLKKPFRSADLLKMVDDVLAKEVPQANQA